MILLAGGDDHVVGPHPGECPLPCSVSPGAGGNSLLKTYLPDHCIRAGRGESEYMEEKWNPEGTWDEG